MAANTETTTLCCLIERTAPSNVGWTVRRDGPFLDTPSRATPMQRGGNDGSYPSREAKPDVSRCYSGADRGSTVDLLQRPLRLITFW